MSLPLFLAQTTPADTQSSTVAPASPATNALNAPKEPPWWANQFFPLILAPVVLWMFMSRGKRGTERKRTDMLATLKPGDRVQTIGGILGTVKEVRDTEVILKVDESANVKMRFTRSAIHRVVDEEKPESK